MLWRTATQSQKALLIALAADPEALPFSKAFQMRHGIGPSSSIKASLVSLEKKGIIYRTMAGKYRFVDRFMPYWIDDIRTAPGITG
jgi:predicted transcriptional regulator of viral defense system